MHDWSRYLFLAGSAPFLLLGIAHALATPLRPDEPRDLSPAEPSLAAAMSATGLRLTRRTDMWRAWVGFNLSHSLGAILFAVLTLSSDGASSASGWRRRCSVRSPCSCPASYLALAVKYWFRTPILGCAASFVLFVSSWALQLHGRG